MRLEGSNVSLSWIPSEAVHGMTRLPFDLGLARYDDPPPDVVADPRELVAADQVRFANELRAWIEVRDGRIVDYGYSGGGHINVSTMRLGHKEMSFTAVGLPDLQREPDHRDDTVTFVQTTGGRSGLPAARRIGTKPFLRLSAPLVWTTLTLSIDSSGQTRGGLIGASSFPRHWVYGTDGHLTAKSGTMDFAAWWGQESATQTPWGDTDSPAFVTQVETALERNLSVEIMRGRRRPTLRRLTTGETLVEQGQPGDSVFLLLDGVLEVDVDGARIAEVGPGAILGERALLEDGTRTSTLRALSPCLVAVARFEDLEPSLLAEVSATHRREDDVGRT